MTDNLIPFLRDVVGRVIPFSSLISYIHVKALDDGRLFTAASASDGSIHMRSTSKKPIDVDGARTCLSNLGYLNQVLSSSYMKSDSTVSLRFQERNGRNMISSMNFKPNSRMEVNYLATDPFRASIMRPGQLDITDWPVEFVIDEHAFKEISEFKKIHGAAPSDGDPVLQVNYTEDGIVVEFGEVTSHTSTLELDIEYEAASKKPVGVYMLSDHFIRALQQSQGIDKMVGGFLHKKALKMISETSSAEHEIELVGRKIRDD